MSDSDRSKSPAWVAGESGSTPGFAQYDTEGDATSFDSESDGRIEQVLNVEHLFVSTTVGISMWPMLRNRRDTIIVRPVPAGKRLSVGDVALYKVMNASLNASGGPKYVLHRVIGVRDGWYAIRGDNCLLTEHVRDDQILGRLEEFYRGSRHIECSSSRWYRLYWRTWMTLWPLRCVWKHTRALLGRLLRLFGWKGLHPGRTF